MNRPWGVAVRLVFSRYITASCWVSVWISQCEEAHSDGDRCTVLVARVSVDKTALVIFSVAVYAPYKGRAPRTDHIPTDDL